LGLNIYLKALLKLLLSVSVRP